MPKACDSTRGLPVVAGKKIIELDDFLIKGALFLHETGERRAFAAVAAADGLFALRLCAYLAIEPRKGPAAENGYADLAYEMITKESYPSYGHWAAMGETTLLEHFLPYQDYYRASKNHHFLGDVINWFMRAAGGIHVQSANSVQIAPKFIKKLDFCEAYHELPSGRISVRWDRKDDGIFLKIKSEGDIKYSVCFDENENVTLL